MAPRPIIPVIPRQQRCPGHDDRGILVFHPIEQMFHVKHLFYKSELSAFQQKSPPACGSAGGDSLLPPDIFRLSTLPELFFCHIPDEYPSGRNIPRVHQGRLVGNLTSQSSTSPVYLCPRCTYFLHRFLHRYRTSQKINTGTDAATHAIRITLRRIRRALSWYVGGSGTGKTASFCISISCITLLVITCAPMIDAIKIHMIIFLRVCGVLPNFDRARCDGLADGLHLFDAGGVVALHDFPPAVDGVGDGGGGDGG